MAALGNLLTRNDANNVAVVAAGALPPPVKLLRDGLDQSRTYTAFALGNLAQVGNNVNKAAVLAAGALLLLVDPC